MNPSMPWKQDHGTDWWVGSGMDWEFVVDGCRLLDTGWLNNKVLLCGPGNCSQYPVMNHSGEEDEKERVRVCVYMKLNHFALQQKLTQDCELTILQFKKIKLHYIHN